MQSSFSNTTEEDSLPNQWINWCRLCAKEDNKNNINLLYENEKHSENYSKKLSIQEALAKYFWVQTSLEDTLPQMLCTDCLTLVSSMINFNERVHRVQLMYLHLVDVSNSSLDLNTVRLEFDVTESERDHWFSKYSVNDKNPDKLTIKENIEESTCEGKYNVQIKQENGEKFMAMDYDKYMEEDTELEKEEIVFDDVNDYFAEDDEDPFQHNEKVRAFAKSSSCEEDSLDMPERIESKTIQQKSKLEKSKKRKRKKLKSFSSLECSAKKINIKDFSMEVVCKDCGESFTKYMLYRQHLQQQHDQSMSKKEWQCPACDRVLLSLSNLERHVHIHEPAELRKTIKCPECDNRYTTNAQLDTHIRYKHKNEKPFVCEECGLCLRTNSNLRQHMLTHTDLAPFECEVCKKKFKNKIRLKTHMDIHSPNKHICNICGLQLNSRATLNRHFLVHSDKMQHKCDCCGRAFKRAKALKNHLLLHTGLKPYSCDFCERTFANGSNCRSHMKKIHTKELAVLEASGSKTHTKNIPKLETLKAVTKAADNLTPVVSKFSGCFAFGKKPKLLETGDGKPLQTLKNLPATTQPNREKLSKVSPSSTPLDLQYIPLVGNTTTSAACLPDAKNLENELSITTMPTTAIPNFDNIYQHLMKQNQADLFNKRPLTQISPHSTPSNVGTPHHTSFYQHQQPHNDITDRCLKPPSHSGDDLLHSPDSRQSSITPLTHDDHSNASSIQATFYGSVRTTLPPSNFM